jgi:hypothetical protein
MRDVGQQSLPETLTPLSVFSITMRLVAQAANHHQLTTANVNKTSAAAADYNFCLDHERIETMILAILTSLSSSPLLAGPESELRVLAFVIALGARIALYKTAIVKVQKASLLAPVAGESRKMSVTAANTMGDVLLEADVLSPNHVGLFSNLAASVLPRSLISFPRLL